MGSDAVLRSAMHLPCADLDLQRVAVAADDGCVEALVHVIFGCGDVVVDLARNGFPQPVHDAQDAVAVRDALRDHAEAAHVVDALEWDPLAPHLLVNAIDVFGPACDLCLGALFGQLLLEDLDVALDAGLAIGAACLDE